MKGDLIAKENKHKTSRKRNKDKTTDYANFLGNNCFLYYLDGSNI